MRLTTNRLELIAGNLDLSQAELTDRARFARLLDAQVPEWPPPLNDQNSITWMRDFYAQNPDAIGWAVWYFVLRGGQPEERVAIGNGGFKGRPATDGSVEVGYSVLERYQRQGYASEAVHALVGWAFDHPQVARVLAETLPELTASMRVLEKNGFHYIGPGSGEGVIRYEIKREEFGKVAKQPRSS